MTKLLDATGVVPDRWTWIDEDDPQLLDVPALYPLAFWTENRSQINADSGIWLTVDAEPDGFAEFLPDLPIIAIRFDAFTDGRGLSLATLLRGRYQYRGELRAAGAVHEDLVNYLHRCGFDSYLFDDERDIDVALRAIQTPRCTYQGSIRQPEPAFRRTAARS